MQSTITKNLLMQILVVCVGLNFAVHVNATDQFKLNLIVAERGDPDTQFFVANFYEEGRGVKKDLKQAYEWYNKAANNNHSDAQFKLGLFYQNGWGVKKDQDKAKFWYKVAEKNGSSLSTKHRASKETIKSQLAKRTEFERKQQLELDKKKRRDRRNRKRQEAERVKRDQEIRRTRARRKQEIRTAKVQNEIKLAAVGFKSVIQSVDVVKVLSDKDKAVARKKFVNMVFTKKWFSNNRASSILPSSINNCVIVPDSEIVCFSTRQGKIISYSKVNYTTKSLIKDIQHNGDFTLKYYFNVTDINTTKMSGIDFDPLGLRLVEGWQEPQINMLCKIKNSAIFCNRNGVQFTFNQ